MSCCVFMFLPIGRVNRQHLKPGQNCKRMKKTACNVKGGLFLRKQKAGEKTADGKEAVGSHFVSSI